MKKLFFLIFISLAPLVQAATLADIRTAVRILIKDTSTDRQRYTNAQLDEMINEGQQDVIINVLPLDDNTSIMAVAGTTCYTMPDAFVHIKRVTYDYVLLSETSYIKLDADNSGSKWETITGRPQMYYQPDNSAQLCVYPYPNTATDVGTIRAIYNNRADALVNDSDVPYNGELRFAAYHDLLKWYAAYRIFVIEGQVEKSSVYAQEYTSRLQNMGDVTGTAPNYLPSMGGTATSRSGGTSR